MDKVIQENYMRAGRLAGEALIHGLSIIDEGVRYLEVAEEIEGLIKKHAKIAFPVNISVNEIAAHDTPTHDDPRVFHKGDLVKIDVGAHVDGYIGDTAKTVEVGTKRHTALIDSSERALEAGLRSLRENIPVSQIGAAIEDSVRADNFVPIDNLNGHQLEQYVLHAGVSIPSIRGKNGGMLHGGDVVAIEPFVTLGTGRVKNSRDGNIYHLAPSGVVRFPRAREIYPLLKKQFGSLPFAERWLTDIIPQKQIPLTLAMLQRRQLVTAYQTLVEVSGHMVAQAEHTAIVTLRGCEVTTRL